MRRPMLRANSIAAAAVIVTSCALGSGSTQAQNLPSAAPAAAKATSTSKSLQLVLSGVKAYRAGKMDTAISTLTKALSSGGLASTDLAKGLYYRGLAYQRARKPAQAIADLTSAIWIKGGLSEKERQDALKSRSAAYKAAGIAEPSGAASASRTPAPATTTATGTTPGTSWQASTKTASGATASPPSTQQTGAPTTLNVAPVGTPAPAAQPAPSGSTTSNPLSNVGTFFSNIFGSSGNQPAKPSPSPQHTLSPPQNPPGAPPNAVSGWNSETRVAATPNAAAPARRTATATAAPQQRAAKKFSGRYTIRLTSVRSRAVAEKVASTMSQQHASALKGRTPGIATQTFGNMGTFYNVEVGPFAKPGDYKPLCLAAQKSGYDCLVLKK